MAITDLGLLGSNSTKGGGSTLAFTNSTGAIIPAGTLIHIATCSDNIASATAPTITCSTVGGGTAVANHATAIGSGVTTTAGTGVWHQCFRVLTTADIANGAQIALLTWNQLALAKAVHAEGWTGVTATLRGTVATGTSTTGSPSVATAGTALVAGDLVIGSVSFENNVQMTGDADTLNGTWDTIVGTFTVGNPAASNTGTGTQDKVVTATGAQTYNPTGGVADTVACVYSLVPQPEPTVTQAAYRFYADGTETGSTALAAQDTAYTADLTAGDVNLLLRTRLQETAGSPLLAATDDWQLQWEKNASGLWVNVGSASPVDGYGIGNSSGSASVNGTNLEYAQAFTGDGATLSQAVFYLSKLGSPTGTVSAALYAHDGGTYGGTGLPTGTPLKTSVNSVTASTIPITPVTAYTFTFDLAPAVTLQAGTPYFISLVASGGAAAGQDVTVALDVTSPTHPGRAARFNGTSWIGQVTDLIFEVDSTGLTVANFDSANLTDGAATTNRLGAGTGTFQAGKVSEDGLVDNVGWTGNNYTEVLYALTLKQADLANADALRFRVLRNGVTTGLTYTATPTVNVTIGAAVQPPRNIHQSNPATVRSFTW